MDKIEKIRQEIERHRQAIRVLNEHTAPEQMSKTCAIFQYSDSILFELLSFLDTLSEEPDKSLEEKIERYLPQIPEEPNNEELRVFAHHFAQWGAEHSGSSEIPNDLEEAAKNYTDSSEWLIGENLEHIEAAFIAGAEWQKEQDTRDMFMSDNRHFQKVYELGKKDMKEQMLKDAVEGRVFMSFAPGHNQMVMADVDLPTNTKVRIVVLKEEE